MNAGSRPTTGMLGPKCCRPSGTGWGKIYHGHGARQLKQPLSSGPDEAKKEDYQPVGRDGQPIYRPALTTVEIFQEFQNKFISIYN